MQPDKQQPFDGLSIINYGLSYTTQLCIESESNPDPKLRRGIDFAAIDRSVAAAEQLVATHGADARPPVMAMYHGKTASEILERLRAVQAHAAPFRPKERRA